MTARAGRLSRDCSTFDSRFAALRERPIGPAGVKASRLEEVLAGQGLQPQVFRDLRGSGTAITAMLPARRAGCGSTSVA